MFCVIEYRSEDAALNPFFTIGHSTRSLTEFVDLLGQSEIGLVADVRTVPRSRTNPQYNANPSPTRYPIVGSRTAGSLNLVACANGSATCRRR